MIPLLHCFLVDNMAPRGLLLEVTQCIGYLRRIVGLLQLVAEKSMGYIDKLRDLISKHHVLYSRIYPSEAVKSKFHQIFHIWENMVWAGRLLSCFVTERKHRTLKGPWFTCFGTSTSNTLFWLTSLVDIRSVSTTFVPKHCSSTHVMSMCLGPTTLRPWRHICSAVRYANQISSSLRRVS